MRGGRENAPFRARGATVTPARDSVDRCCVPRSVTRAAWRLDVGKEPGQESDRREERADGEHGVDARRIGKLSQHRRTKVAGAKGEAEEHARNGADPSGNELLREHD